MIGLRDVFGRKRGEIIFYFASARLVVAFDLPNIFFDIFIFLPIFALPGDVLDVRRVVTKDCNISSGILFPNKFLIKNERTNFNQIFYFVSARLVVAFDLPNIFFDIFIFLPIFALPGDVLDVRRVVTKDCNISSGILFPNKFLIKNERTNFNQP